MGGRSRIPNSALGLASAEAAVAAHASALSALTQQAMDGKTRDNERLAQMQRRCEAADQEAARAVAISSRFVPIRDKAKKPKVTS